MPTFSLGVNFREASLEMERWFLPILEHSCHELDISIMILRAFDIGRATDTKMPSQNSSNGQRKEKNTIVILRQCGNRCIINLTTVHKCSNHGRQHPTHQHHTPRSCTNITHQYQASRHVSVTDTECPLVAE
jgi:hypothetical protein